MFLINFLAFFLVICRLGIVMVTIVAGGSNSARFDALKINFNLKFDEISFWTHLFPFRGPINGNSCFRSRASFLLVIPFTFCCWSSIPSTSIDTAFSSVGLSEKWIMTQKMENNLSDYFLDDKKLLHFRFKKGPVKVPWQAERGRVRGVARGKVGQLPPPPSYFWNLVKKVLNWWWHLRVFDTFEWSSVGHFRPQHFRPWFPALHQAVGASSFAMLWLWPIASSVPLSWIHGPSLKSKSSIIFGKNDLALPLSLLCIDPFCNESLQEKKPKKII